MQMLGRAGRPQFDTSAVAVIITKEEKVSKYEKLMQGSEMLESSLHLHLIEHLNAEIVLRTIRDMETAKRWLEGTFLYVRLQRNSGHYKVEGDRSDASQDMATGICRKDLELLKQARLVTTDAKG